MRKDFLCGLDITYLSCPPQANWLDLAPYPSIAFMIGCWTVHRANSLSATLDINYLLVIIL